ncbi:hypothetical protein [Fontivita pretiosa]
MPTHRLTDNRLDGELIGNDPATFTIAPAALRVLVGPKYRHDLST